MIIKWYGHSCFYIESRDGMRVVTDPFDPTVGYKVPELEADIITMSHDHYDHNYVQCVHGDYVVLNQPGNYDVNGMEVKGTKSFHDEVGGQKRGSNVIFNIKVDGIKICHMGDLGHIPDNAQIKEMGDVDILLIPVGGIYTIDAKGAVEIIDELKPKVVIPMHHKTPDLKFNLGKLDQFIEKLKTYSQVNLKELNITSQDLKEYIGRVVVLDYIH